MAGDSIALTKLFEPFQLGPLRLPNRIVMAPMSRNRADDADTATPLTALYYRQRASAALIITEASPITPGGRASFRAPGIWSETQAGAWRSVCDAVHAEGGRIFLQLWHAGRISHPMLQPEGQAPVAPSPIAPPGTLSSGRGVVPFQAPRALETNEIPVLVRAFAAGARTALRAGFDGVEIHAANGYLIDAFLRDGTNQRADAYGGSIEKRARLLLEVVNAVAAEWGAERMTVRLSPASHHNGISDSQPQKTFAFAAEQLARRHILALHVDETSSTSFDWTAFRKRYDGVYIANAGYDRARAEAAIASGHADLISFGSLFLANPDLVERLRTGAPLNAPDRGSYYGGAERGYTDYPTLS